MNVVGRTFRLKDNTASEISRRMRQAWAKVARLRPILRQRTALEHRVKIVKACVYQSLLWGAETWHITRRRCQQLRGFEKKVMRILIPCPKDLHHLDNDEKFAEWDGHIRNLLGKLKHLLLDERWLCKWYSWAGHLCRLPADRWARKMQMFRNVDWWRAQQQNEQGFRHHQRRGNLSRWENILVRHHDAHHKWSLKAQDRIEWGKGKEGFIARVLGRPHLQTPEETPGTALVPDTVVPPNPPKPTPPKRHRPPRFSEENVQERGAKAAKYSLTFSPEQLQAPLLDLVDIPTPRGTHGLRARLRPSHGGATATATAAGAAPPFQQAQQAVAATTPAAADGRHTATQYPQARQCGQAKARQTRALRPSQAAQASAAAAAAAAQPQPRRRDSRRHDLGERGPEARQHDLAAIQGWQPGNTSTAASATAHRTASSSSSASTSSSTSTSSTTTSSSAEAGHRQMRQASPHRRATKLQPTAATTTAAVHGADEMEFHNPQVEHMAAATAATAPQPPATLQPQQQQQHQDRRKRKMGSTFRATEPTAATSAAAPAASVTSIQPRASKSSSDDHGHREPPQALPSSSSPSSSAATSARARPLGRHGAVLHASSSNSTSNSRRPLIRRHAA